MKEVTIDFRKCTNLHDLYQEIKQKLNIPDQYGENADALWDSLTGHIEHPIQIYIVGIPSLENDLQTLALEIANVFLDAEKFLPDIQVFLHQKP